MEDLKSKLESLQKQLAHEMGSPSWCGPQLAPLYTALAKRGVLWAHGQYFYGTILAHALRLEGWDWERIATFVGSWSRSQQELLSREAFIMCTLPPQDVPFPSHLALLRTTLRLSSPELAVEIFDRLVEDATVFGHETGGVNLLTEYDDELLEFIATCIETRNVSAAYALAVAMVSTPLSKAKRFR